MAQDPFIDRMLAETFEPDGSSRSFQESTEQDFRLRRGLARLPVTTLEGQWFSPGLARFNMLGKIIDIPLNHVPVRGWTKFDGGIVEENPFIDVCGRALRTKFTHLLVMQSDDDRPWLVFWNNADEIVDEAKLKSLFRGPEKFKKSA